MLTLLIHIGQNIALLFALTYGYSLLWSPLKRLEHLNHYLYSVTIGALFGIIAGLGMLDPIVLYPGFFLDGRTVMITLVGVIEGPVAALLTTILVIFVRWEIGGSGTFFCIATAVPPVFLGWAGRVYPKRNFSK